MYELRPQLQYFEHYSRSRRKRDEQTVISVRINLVHATYYSKQHDVDGTTTKNSDQRKAWLLNTPGVQEAEHSADDPPTSENNTQGLREQMQNSNEVTQRCPQIPQNTNSLRDTRNNTTHARTRSSKKSLLSNFTPRTSRLQITRVLQTSKTLHEYLYLLHEEYSFYFSPNVIKIIILCILIII